MCGGQPPPRTTLDTSTPVVLNDCHSAEDGRLNRISEYAQILKALKPDPSQIYLT